MLLLVFVAARPSWAGECAVIEGGDPALAHIDASVRLRFLDERMDVAAHRGMAWAAGWGTTYSVLTITQLAITPAFSNPRERIDYYVGAGASFVGVITAIAMPPKVLADHRWWKRRLAHSPAGEDPCALLSDAERLLLRDAEAERKARSPVIHAGNMIFNIGIGALLGFVFDRWTAAAVNTFVGAAVGEIVIATNPTESIETLRHYRAGLLGPVPRPFPLQFSVGVRPLQGGGTVHFGFDF